MRISQNETEMAQWLLKNGPISIGINANGMQFYMGGVSHPWSFLCSKTSLDHGMTFIFTDDSNSQGHIIDYIALLSISKGIFLNISNGFRKHLLVNDKRREDGGKPIP